MNKRELIERIDKLPYIEGPIADTVTVNRSWILESIEQLDEPQKPVVPKYVAKWFEEHKHNLDMSICHVINSGGRIASLTEFSEFELWFGETLNPIFTLVSMLQFGYTVEKEKKYTVKLTKTQQYLYCIDNDFTFVTYARPDDNPRLYHTRKELEKAGFGEVFNSPLFEVEEVEE